MSLISRQNKKAYKNSNHNKDLILTNFLPIKNISLFDECKQYIENLKVKDITSSIAERNGTLTILHEPTESIYSLYTNNVGYVRFMKNCDRYQILNFDIKHNKENSYFFEEIQQIDSIDEQLYLIVKHIIYSS